ncbi:MAG: hypothetical protein CSB47_02690 [Proteobacteria bacterium]|nr:MAG: hypothetical protein CSB47_02690 [Pseudomonadota bacterium]
MSKNTGFSLIELVITVAVIGILSSIAIPSYTKYVRETKRTEAKTEILRIAQLQESYYVQHLSYAKALNDAGGLGFASEKLTTESGLYFVQVWGLDSSNNIINSCDGTNTTPCVGYKIRATPVTGKGQDNDSACSGGFQLWNTGLKQAKGSGDSDWSVAATARECWN